MSGADLEAFENAARLLASTGQYRILRQIRPTTGFHAPSRGRDHNIGVAIDVETTGLDYTSDRIIELAVQRFSYDRAGRICKVGQPRVWREDPDCVLDPRITRLTGLTDDMLKGQAIDDAEASRILASADLIVAHNARFDRPFVDKRLPAIAGKAWACSLAEPDWLHLGFDGRALAHLLMQCGWFYDGHRAEADVLALIYLLAHKLPDGQTVMSHLMIASDTPGFRINAVDAPFASKDRLKARGYRWDPILRFWTREIPGAELDAEETWLKTDVYAGHGEPVLLAVSACDRYKAS